ncbi:Synembryn-like C3E7.04c-like protein [Cladobotryum mycophilum]|uniref:Synembryn-like C3E7.04c-like protein n=1 Tax=Cladobotryum mycophilum TaxID=491253 RepID=A0ABR0SLB1_9HYPO
MADQGTATAKGPAKLKAVTELVEKLTEDLDKITLLPKARNGALEALKVYGREPEYADPIFTQEGISMLLRHSFHSPSGETARAALRVLANAMLLKPETRQMFVDQAFAARACSELKTENWDNEFLISRILFLSTYGTDVNLEDLITNHHLADRIVDNLARHAKLATSKFKSKTKQPMEDMALSETLKLLFNVTHFCKDEAAKFDGAVPHIVTLFWRQDIPTTKPLEAPFGPLVNALLNMELSTERSQAAVYPQKPDPNKVALRLIDLLDKSMKAYTGNDLETVVTPVFSLLGKVHEHAPPPVRQRIRTMLLPTAEDRKSVLGRGDTLSAKILKNSTNPTAPALREAISQLLFDMSDKDASKFVENVGYGFASGFLFQNNVPIPTSASEAFSTGDPSGAQRPVNPITGQFLDEESIKEGPALSQAEKEREAERLFVLFERLKQNGIIDIQNPVEAAIREGRFREIPEDEVEELE